MFIRKIVHLIKVDSYFSEGLDRDVSIYECKFCGYNTNDSQSTRLLLESGHKCKSTPEPDINERIRNAAHQISVIEVLGERVRELVLKEVNLPWMATTTIGDMADLFCCTTDDITDAVDGNDDLDMIVGGQIGGGGGHFGFDTEDEYRVEWVGE